MDRIALYETLERIKGNAALAQNFLSNEDSDARVAAELIGRADIIESKLAELRGRLTDPSGRPDGLPPREKRISDNVHLIGDRPGSDAA